MCYTLLCEQVQSVQNSVVQLLDYLLLLWCAWVPSWQSEQNEACYLHWSWVQLGYSLWDKDRYVTTVSLWKDQRCFELWFFKTSKIGLEWDYHSQISIRLSMMVPENFLLPPILQTVEYQRNYVCLFVCFFPHSDVPTLEFSVWLHVAKNMWTYR